MIDIRRLIGFLCFSESHYKFQLMRDAMLQIAPTLDADDGAVILDQYCQGPGQITAACANLKAVANEDQFVDFIKLTVNEMGLSDADCPKVLLLVSNEFSPRCQRNIVKMQNRIESWKFDITLKALQLSGAESQADLLPRVYVNDAKELRSEIKGILESVHGNI